MGAHSAVPFHLQTHCLASLNLYEMGLSTQLQFVFIKRMDSFRVPVITSAT